MKRLGLLTLFVLGFGLLLPLHVSAQATNPAQVVKDYIATANTGN